MSTPALATGSAEDRAPAPSRRRAGRIDLAWALIGGLTLVALVLRLVVADQALYGDELYTFDELHGRSLGAALDAVTGGPEVSPPLYFVLAWAAAKLGDPIFAIRLPSLLLGAATVPVAYALGLRTVGARGALCGAALVALSPFAIFYSSEARPYATAFFFAALSTLALVAALQTGRRWWWALAVAASLAALYTHYTTIFVIGAQGLWALWAWPGRRRAVLVALAGTALLYLPWLPSLDDKGRLDQYRFVAGELTPFKLGANLSRTAIGHPLLQASVLPGTLAVAVLAALAVVGLAALARSGRMREAVSDRGVVLLAALALAAPLGLGAYVLLGGTNLVLPRNLGTSVVPISLLAGALFTSPRRLLGLVLPLAVVGIFAIDAARTVRSSTRRPPYDDVAAAIERGYRTGDVVAELQRFRLRGPIARTLSYELGRGIPVVHRPLAWNGAAVPPGRRLFVVVPRWVSESPPRLVRRLRLQSATTYRGLDWITLYVYSAGR